MMKTKQLETLLYSSVGLAAMFLIVVAFNVIAGAFKTRVDLTPERAYTLSAGTKKILSKLDTPVKIRFYFTQSESSTPVPLKTYAQRVEDLLAEYKQAAKGKLVIEKLDPQPDSDAEDSANLDGVEGQMISAEAKVYLGLAISMLDEKVAIPFLSPDRERLLEYDITRQIARVMKPEKPVVGVMSALQVSGQPPNPMMMRMGQQPQDAWVFISELRRDFDVRAVEMTSDRIDDDIKVLVVIHPKDITDKVQYAIDQFVLRGGKLIAFLDPLSFAENRSNPNPNPMARFSSAGSTLDKLLKAWGINFDNNKVVADMNFAWRGVQRGREVVQPTVLAVTKEGLDAGDVVTGQIDNLLLGFAGVFTGTPAEGLKQTVLVKTSPNSQLVERFMAEMGEDQIRKDFKSEGKAYPVMIRLTGKFKTAFPDGKPEDKTEDKDKPEGKKEEKKAGDSLKVSAKETSVVLAGDADWVSDTFSVQVQNLFGQKIAVPFNGNLGLGQSLVELMSGDDSLIGIRSRATLNRPFTLIRKMQEQAEQNYRSKIKELEDSLKEAQQKLNELQAKKDKNQRFILSPEQQQELKKFREKEADVKRQLKEERKKLRRDIDSLENRLKWINIAAMPIVVTLSGITLAILKRKRMKAK